MRTRLAAMMFLQYAVQGLWTVPLAAFLMASPHEGGLNMSAGRVALIYATMSIGALVSPLLLGLICDRLVAVQRMLAGLHLVGAVLLAAMFVWSVSSGGDARTAFLECSKDVIIREDDGQTIPLQWVVEFKEDYETPSTWSSWSIWEKAQAYFGIGTVGQRRHQSLLRMRDYYEKLLLGANDQIRDVRSRPAAIAAAERAFPPLFSLMLGYACVYLPTISLSNVVAFRNLPEPGRQFGKFRALGTLGWIAAGLFVGFAAPAVSPLCFLFAAVASAVLAGLCLVLPNTPPVAYPPGSPRRISDRFGLPALKMLADRSFFVYVLTALVATALISFHNIYTNKFLVDLHVDHPAAVQTLAQPTEILGAMFIPWVWARLGTRWMLCLGLVASAARFAMYATASRPEVIGFGLPLHGVGFAFFYIAAYLYVDREAPADLRASAQGLVTVLTLGIGGLAGNWFAGQVVESYTTGGVVDWRPVWLVPAIGTFAGAAFFALFFRDEKSVRLAPSEKILASATERC
jgi:nucleoside transporter